MRKFLLSIAALLIAGAASAQPIGVKLVRDDTNGRLLLRGDDGAWLLLYGSGAPSFSTFLGSNVPANTVYFNTASGTPYYHGTGTTWTAASGGTAAAVTPATTTVGTCASGILYADASSVLQCGTSLKYTDTGTGNFVISMRKSFLAETNGPFNIDGTMPVGVPTHAVFVRGTPTDGTSLPRLFETVLAAGYTGSNATALFWGAHQTAGTDTAITNGGNAGVDLQTTATTVGTNIGLRGIAQGGNFNIGVVGRSGGAKAAAPNIGVYGIGLNTTSTIHAGGYFTLATANPTIATADSSAVIADNAGVAANIILARDNGAAIPTTGPTATWRVADGGWSQQGNGVLTSGTATATVQARESGSLIHAYDITTAMINTALGAGTTGDVLMATLPAKTVVKNAYVIITEAAAGPNTLTIACGRTSATYVDYIVASDAKAAANTVYGDASAERGTNLTGYDLPSYTGTTAVNCHFVAGNTTDLTTGQERLVLETSLIP